ncbi:hypothetical protein [Rhodoblastus sp.]|uniref:hypothetical protein n=1 Tax=Rhodoblastus sp. TaxID=1962975 RepID=UPI0035B2E839
MPNLIPQPAPQSRNPSAPYGDGGWNGEWDASADQRWTEAPEIEFQPVYRRRAKWRAYAASAGVLLLTLGVGLAAADKIGGYFGPPPVDPVAIKAAEALNAAQAQRQELAALRVHVENLKSKLETQAQKSRSADATIASLQKSLADEKADAASSASQLQAKIEKIQSQAAEKAAKEKENIDKTPTASIPKPLPRPAQIQANAQAIIKQTSTARAAEGPGPYRGFVVRDIGPGRALVEGGGRIEEVEPGDILPGGAMVERIERRGQSWVVLTDRGYIGPDMMWDE